MSVHDEAMSLREAFRVLSADMDKSVLLRYSLPQHGMWRRSLQKCATVLSERGLKLGYVPRHVWPAGLKHGLSGAGRRTLLVWAPGVEVMHGSSLDVREVCLGFGRLLENTSEFVPVLVTDKPEFAFYSRLGWLVEFLPTLSADAQAYRDDKLRYLAWRYRDAVLVPAVAAFVSESDWRTLTAT